MGISVLAPVSSKVMPISVVGSLGGKHRFNCIRKLNTDMYSAVYEAVDMENGKHVAIKIVKRTSNNEPRLRQEFEVQQSIVHPNIANIFGYRAGHHHIYLMQELLTGGDLYEAVTSSKEGITEQLALSWIRDILYALKALHAREVIHGDIKLENVMLAGDGTVKLIDFGFACFTNNVTAKAVGTREYMSAEMLAKGRDKVDLKKVDMWAVGILLFCLLTSGNEIYEFPWDQADSSDINFQVFCKTGQFFRNDFLPAARFLLSNLLDIDAEKRCTAAEALEFVDELWHFGKYAKEEGSSEVSEGSAESTEGSDETSGMIECFGVIDSDVSTVEDVNGNKRVVERDERMEVYENKRHRAC